MHLKATQLSCMLQAVLCCVRCMDDIGRQAAETSVRVQWLSNRERFAFYASSCNGDADELCQSRAQRPLMWLQ
jgi:hypothetical protein